MALLDSAPKATSVSRRLETPSAPQRGRKPHFDALTGLRFFLALWVILHHLTGRNTLLDAWARTLPMQMYTLIRAGYLAVGTFFVLSGFVLARSYMDAKWNRQGLVRYAFARVARVYPVYLLSILIVSPIIFADLFSPGKPFLLPDRTALLTNYLAVLQGWTGTPRVNWNTPAWSLSCELFFYLCFPLVAVLLRQSSLRRSIGTAALALLLPALCFRLGVPDSWKPLVHFPDFLLGISIAGAYDWLASHRCKGRGAWLYVPATIAGVAVLLVPQITWGWTTLTNALRPIDGLLLLGLALGGGLPVRGLSHRMSVFLGKASYSMYILHIPVMWWYKRTWFHISGALSQELSAALYVAIVIGLSAAVYRWVEEPANHRIRAWAK